jgi:hypothetical protein
LGHVIGRALDFGDGANALAAAPNVLPGFGRNVTAKVHFAGVALREIVRIHTSVTNGRRQIIAMYTGE